MTLEEFEVITTIIGANPESSACISAREVLIGNKGQAEAARDLGITRGTVHNAVTRYIAVDTLIRSAYCSPRKKAPAGGLKSR